MIEVLLAGGIWGLTEYLKRSGDDATKIRRIARKCGLTVKYDGKEDTIKLLRVNKNDEYKEYVFKIPEGLSYKDFQKKHDHIEHGINTSNNLIPLSALKGFDLKGDIKKQIQSIVKTRTAYKEVYISYDRVLKMRVYHKPLADFLPYENKCKGWNVPIGKTRTHNIQHDFEKIPHFVVGGTTRYGKSVFLKNVITTLTQNKPNEASFSLIDLKGGLTFNRFRELEQVTSIASDAETSLETLKTIESNMNEVMDYLKVKGFENVQEANIKNRHFVIIDEAAQLSPAIEKDKDIKAIKNECEQILIKISSQGGALGYRLIYATQSPYSEILNHNIKQNCDAKLSFKLQTDKASEVVLGEGITDASHLPLIKGRGVYLTDRKEIVQTPFIENKYIERVLEDVKKKQN